FQAEDGIRDRNVTGVQTCALPISILSANILKVDGDYFADAPVKIIEKGHLKIGVLGLTTQYIPNWEHPSHIQGLSFSSAVEVAKIGRASCRERDERTVGAGSGGRT